MDTGLSQPMVSLTMDTTASPPGLPTPTTQPTQQTIAPLVTPSNPGNANTTHSTPHTIASPSINDVNNNNNNNKQLVAGIPYTVLLDMIDAEIMRFFPLVQATAETQAENRAAQIVIPKDWTSLQTIFRKIAYK